MQAKEIEHHDGRRTFAIVFDTADEVSEGLSAFAGEHDIQGAYFTAIGALREVTLGFWNPLSKEYRTIPIREQVEVLSLAGNVARTHDGQPKVHAHIVVGKSDGTAHGGHLMSAVVRPTLEVILVESPRHLRRTTDPETGLPLLDLTA